MARNKTIQYWKTRNIVSAVFMLLVLSFLTVSNTFLYGSKATAKAQIAQDVKKTDKPLPNTAEEKSQSSSISNNITEEYLHEHHSVEHTSFTLNQSHQEPFYLFYTGKNYAQLHAQPPDAA